MKVRKPAVEIQQLDERRYAIRLDGVVRYVGTREERQRRAALLVAKDDREAQDRALGRLSRFQSVAGPLAGQPRRVQPQQYAVLRSKYVP